MPKAAVDTAVAAALPAASAIVLTPDVIASMVAGLSGAVLSRMVFVSSEDKRLKRRQTLGETLPLTLIATLITEVIVYERHLGLSLSTFVGLGVGWSVILLLDVFGEWVMNRIAPERIKITDMQDLRDATPEMLDALSRMKRNEEGP